MGCGKKKKDGRIFDITRTTRIALVRRDEKKTGATPIPALTTLIPNRITASHATI